MAGRKRCAKTAVLNLSVLPLVHRKTSMRIHGRFPLYGEHYHVTSSC
ncbi:hypothetical protein HMPREF9163_02101 [Selenomonas sp. oral taxon 138 str. F0429]|nr:hypothetical protein HMPREF9163_02101 [Selenomonas sp. oral taxon 138 str. F0429]